MATADDVMLWMMSSNQMIRMAASSSDEGSNSAPRIFDISSNVLFVDDSNVKATTPNISTPTCFVCTGSKRAFYCQSCIRDGLFARSTALHFPESFLSKKERLSSVNQRKLVTLDLINSALTENVKADQLKREIAECQERIQLLRLLLRDVHVITEKSRSEGIRRIEEIESRKRNVLVYNEKVRSMQEERQRRQLQINHRRIEYDSCCSELQVAIRENVDHLVKFIFPIDRIKSDDNGGESTNEDTVSAIADASRTAYIRGRWVYSDNSQDGKYRIVEALLPSNGDYSAYNEWVAASLDCVPGSSTELIHRNPGSAISTGLTCATQLVSVLAFYLDVWLPKKLCYSEFCSRELGEREFARKVAKLNANVIHLCLSQGVNPDVLRPRHTISNLMLLLNDELVEQVAPMLALDDDDDDGRGGSVRRNRRLGSRWHAAFEVNADLMRCMEESLLQDLTDAGAGDQDGDCTDEDDDEGRDDIMDLFADWETISPQLEQPNLPGRVTMSALPSPGGSPPSIGVARAMRYGTTTHQYHLHNQQPSDPTTASMAGGLVSAAASVASWWRATIGHK